MRPRCGGNTEIFILRQPILFDFRRAVLVGAAVNDRLYLEIAVRRRRRRRPLQGVGLPGISVRLLAGDQTPDEIKQEEKLRSAQKQRADRNEHVPMLQRQQELVLGRIVNSPHVPRDAEEVHGEKTRR